MVLVQYSKKLKDQYIGKKMTMKCERIQKRLANVEIGEGYLEKLYPIRNDKIYYDYDCTEDIKLQTGVGMSDPDDVFRGSDYRRNVKFRDRITGVRGA